MSEANPDLSRLVVEYGDSGYPYGEEQCVGEGGHFFVEDDVDGGTTWYHCERCSVPAWIEQPEGNYEMTTEAKYVLPDLLSDKRETE